MVRTAANYGKIPNEPLLPAFGQHYLKGAWVDTIAEEMCSLVTTGAFKQQIVK